MFTRLGTLESKFAGYCYGKMPVYYRRQHLRLLNSQLNEAVRAGLPEHCSIESEKPVPS